MKQVGYCCCRLSCTLWRRRKVTFLEATAKQNDTQRCLLAHFSWGKRLLSVMASLCWPFTVPCCILAEEMSICRPALILPLCMTQSVTLDSLTQRMFHGGTVISTFTAQLVDCQLQLLFPHPFSEPATFFLFTSEPISVCFPYDCKGNETLVKIHTEPVG